MSQQMKATRSSAAKAEERRRPRSGWLAITGLLLLSALPVLGGVLRLRDVSADPESAVLLASSVPIVAHIVAMSMYCLLGAFQFSPALRISGGWHRTAGRALIPAGFIAALSAVWLAVFFGGPADELALALVRLVFGVAMTVVLVLAVIAITRRDFTAHGAWMTRAYAIAVSGGTQALVFALWTLVVGEVDAFGEAWLVAAGFVINSVVAELLIRRRLGRRMRGVPGRGALVS
ncbi:DUF2306 domain-containing protein [Agromyces laixinhei]|uniref:DUF2306 domain-containing protein n=1 Tax=Agromyces laixinhei TaxID=2585717 RepID=UPI0018DC2871|nr:DUF2306 domain-containing protein [Agromyces laixinhei]